MRYRLSREAEEDIIAIFASGARQVGVQQAGRYHDLLAKTFQFLAENPEAARERTEITPAVRVHPCETHPIIHVIEENEDILVLRVRHGRVDWQHDEQAQGKPWNPTLPASLLAGAFPTPGATGSPGRRSRPAAQSAGLASARKRSKVSPNGRALSSKIGT
jgi:toxin ParE1/3/4